MNREVPTWQLAPDFMKVLSTAMQRAQDYKLNFPPNWIGVKECYDDIYLCSWGIIEDVAPDLFDQLEFTRAEITKYHQAYSKAKVSTISNKSQFMVMIKAESMLILEIQNFQKFLMKALYKTNMLVPVKKLESDVRGEEVLKTRY